MDTKNNPSANSDDAKQQPVVDRDKVKQEREARRAAKLASKQKQQDKSRDLPADEQKANVKVDTPAKVNATTNVHVNAIASDKTSHRKTQKHGKSAEKPKVTISNPEAIVNDLNKLQINSDSKQLNDVAVDKSEKKQLTKAERRAIQEAQRAAKAAGKGTVKPAAAAAAQPSKKETTEPKASTSAALKPANTQSKSNELVTRKSILKKPPQLHRVKLFNHLYVDTIPANLLNSTTIHPAIVRLGVQYSSGVVKGCNARGLAFMSAIKSVIEEYETPSQKEFSRSLEDVIKSCGSYLQKCRPLAVSVTNAMKFIQFQLQLPKTENDSEVCHKLYAICRINL